MTEQETIYINIGKNKQIQPIDPLICIIKLAMLSVKPEKTKISIHHNSVLLQEPTFYQGVMRWSLGDQKNDIHSLYYPIRRACELYTETSKNSHSQEKKKESFELEHRDVSQYQEELKFSLPEELYNIFKMCQEGINKLMSTYEDHPIITRCLSYYNTILTGQKLSDKSDQEEEIYRNSTYMFKNLWTRQEIHVVNMLLTSMKQGNSEKLLKALEMYLEPLEDRFYRSLSTYNNKI